MVVGDAQPYIACLVTLDDEALPAWLTTHGKPAMSLAEAAEDADVIAEIQSAVDDANKAVSKAEAIKKFKILAVDWTEESGAADPVAQAQAQRRDEGVRGRRRRPLQLNPTPASGVRHTGCRAPRRRP